MIRRLRDGAIAFAVGLGFAFVAMTIAVALIYLGVKVQ